MLVDRFGVAGLAHGYRIHGMSETVCSYSHFLVALIASLFEQLQDRLEAILFRHRKLQYSI
jgi:glutamine synthetase type III